MKGGGWLYVCVKGFFGGSALLAAKEASDDVQDELAGEGRGVVVCVWEGPPAPRGPASTEGARQHRGGPPAPRGPASTEGARQHRHLWRGRKDGLKGGVVILCVGEGRAGHSRFAEQWPLTASL